MAKRKLVETGPAVDALAGLSLDSTRYVDLLRCLVDGAEKLQNNPAQGLIPREDVASDHVLKLLSPHSQEKGGPLKIERISFHEGRGNLIITYPGTTDKTVAFVGSHLDVVPANPETWERDPFKLSVEGDKLYGRGTTDCLGHVALISELMLQLAMTRPALERTVVCVFIASEEDSSIQGVGVDKLMKTGKLDHIKNGPVYWIDVADSQPCVGTAGSLTWTLRATGKLLA
jgi:acetylornithine deacetylase